ncbi:DUF748 domain-containing protein [Vibrio panuliri]|uniref:ATPase n=1 Tax=Vibrio panuliri TaxID=1381081 RepID=A0ABX3FQ02_9VIBR|nr:DUF748 domain-containing protein [Vibrio panuliri]KAB1457330.1 DUF748 domain-containing protein [Vibrio panuliri]OLQ96311.1 ATPase [Vibrio panuliri]
MPSKFKQAVTKFKALPKPVRWGAYAAGGYLSYAALLGLLVPYVAKQQIPEQLSKLIERPVTLTDVKINPFTLQFNLHQFAILEQDQPFVRFEDADFQINFWQSLLNAEVAIEHIKLDKPYVNLKRLDNPDQVEFNFSDIIAAVAKNTATAEQPTEQSNDVTDSNAALFPVRILHTRLSDGQVEFVDGVSGTKLSYPSINLSLGEFFTQQIFDAQANRYQLTIKDSDSATISASGAMQLKPLKVVGNIDIEQIQLPRLWGFAADNFDAKLTSGTLSFSSNYRVEQTLGELPEQDTMSIATDSGRFSIEQVNFDGNGKSVVSLPSLSVSDIAANVNKQLVTLGTIESHGLNVAVSVDDSGVDLASLFTPKSLGQEADVKPEENNAESTSDSEQPWLVKLAGIDLKDYQLNVSEKLITAKANQWVVSPINLSTKQISSDFSQPIEFDLFASLNGKGNIGVQGQADISKQAVDADIDVEALKLSQFQPYIATAVNATLTSGELNTNTKLIAAADGKVKASGSAKVTHLSVRDNKLKKPFVKWRSLAVNKFDFDIEKSKLAIDTLTLSQPYARVVINKDRTTNLGDLVVQQPKSEQKGQANQKVKSQSQPFALSVRKVAFNNGSAFFADNSLTPNFSSGIEQLNGQVGHISSVPGTKASVDISGNIDRYAPVKIKGEINPLLEKPYLDLDVLFKSVELTTVNPYSGTYAGHYIDKGQLTLALNYQLENNQLKGSNHVVIDQLKLGQASESDLATDLPIELAIALLQDRDGVIDLGVDVSGDINDPDFSLGGVIWHTITNIITKAVTAPFSFIAGLADADDELNVIDFASGVSQLSTEQQEKLTTLGEALTSRPKLTLSVDGSVNAVEDSKALALIKFDQLLAAQAKTTAEQLPADLSATTVPIEGPLSDALQALYKNEFGQEAETVRDKIEQELDDNNEQYTDEDLDRRWHIALYNLTLNHQQVSEGELGKLAQQRAQAVKAYLVDVVKIDASRVFLLDSRFDIKQDASEVLLSLEAN